MSGSFSSKKTSLACIRAVRVRSEMARLGSDHQSDPQSRRGPEGPAAAAWAGQTRSLPGPGPRAACPHAGPLSASDPDRATPRVRTRKQTAPSTPPDVFQLGERTPVQRAALVSSNELSRREVGACCVDGAQGNIKRDVLETEMRGGLLIKNVDFFSGKEKRKFGIGKESGWDK